ncbi:MAG: phosphatidylcholine/phosphatidylserine synthase [Lewinella sp.]
MMRSIAAWSVHLFTASGLLVGFMGLLAAIDGDYRMAMCWMLTTLVIDGVDGTFARMAKVKEVLPHVDGKTIDYVIDFFTYAILPAYLFFVAVDMPEWARYAGAFAMLLSAAIYYGLEGMVSEDGKHFIGFPVLWNMVVYVFIFVAPSMSWPITLALVGALSILHFVPIMVPYPSRGGRWWAATLVAVVVFIATAVANVWYFPEVTAWGYWGAIASIAYLMLVTVLDTFSARPQVQGKG